MKKRSLPLPLTLLLLFMGVQTVLSFGTPLAVYLYTVSEVLGFFVLRLFQAAGLLLLLAALGCAFGAVTEGKRARPYIILLLASLAHLFGTILGLVWQALFLRIPVGEQELSLLLGSLMDSSVLPLFITFIAVYLVFLRHGASDTPKGYCDLSSPTARAALLASLIFFVYRLIGQISETVEFVKGAMGFTFLKTEEKVILLLDYLPVIGVAVAGYFLLLFARKAYLVAANKKK